MSFLLGWGRQRLRVWMVPANSNAIKHKLVKDKSSIYVTCIIWHLLCARFCYTYSSMSLCSRYWCNPYLQMRRHKSGFLHAQASSQRCSVIISTLRHHPIILQIQSRRRTWDGERSSVWRFRAWMWQRLTPIGWPQVLGSHASYSASPSLALSSVI